MKNNSRVLDILVFAGAFFASNAGYAQHQNQIWIPARDGGKDIKLEAHIYKPDGDGPFPVILWSHGSTNNGQIHAPEILFDTSQAVVAAALSAAARNGTTRAA